MNHDGVNSNCKIEQISRRTGQNYYSTNSCETIQHLICTCICTHICIRFINILKVIQSMTNKKKAKPHSIKKTKSSAISSISTSRSFLPATRILVSLVAPCSAFVTEPFSFWRCSKPNARKMKLRLSLK